MKKVPIFLGVAAAALLAGNPPSIFAPAPFSIVSQAQAAVSVSVFFEPLGRHGRWMADDQYGYVWVPIGVGPRWAPYVEGRWAYTDRYGWYFVSDEPYAWAVYHYGRWAYADDIGWFWVPGRQWGPAWVSWRRGEGHVGWAPLPPVGRGYAVSFDVDDADIDADWWHFVPTRDFLAPNLSIVIDFDDRDRYYRRSEPLGTVNVVNNIVVNNVINIDYIEKEVDQEVVVHKVEKVEDPQQQAAAEDGAIKAFQPEIDDAQPEEKPEQVANKEEVKAEKQAARTDDPEAKPEDQAKSDADAEPKPEDQAKSDADAKAKPEAKAKSEAKSDADAKAKPEAKAKSEAKSDADAKAKPEAKAKSEAKAKPETKAKPEAKAEPDAKAKAREPAEAEARKQPKPEKRSDAERPAASEAPPEPEQAAKDQDRIPADAGEARGKARQAEGDEQRKQKVN